MFVTNNTGMGLYFEEVDGQWWLVDCFSDGLKDISLDVVAMEIRVWELLFDLVIAFYEQASSRNSWNPFFVNLVKQSLHNDCTLK